MITTYNISTEHLSRWQGCSRPASTLLNAHQSCSGTALPRHQYCRRRQRPRSLRRSGRPQNAKENAAACELVLPEQRGPLDNKFLRVLIWRQKKHLFIAGLALIFATSCNLASPLVSGTLFEILIGRQPASRYTKYLLALAGLYVVEPILTRIYIRQAVTAGEQVLAAMRAELFRVLLLQSVDFYDRTSTAELTGLLSSELDGVRSFIVSNVSRDRGLRAILEASGSVLVLFALSWRLGPILAAVIVSTAATAALYRIQTKNAEQSASATNQAMVSIASQTFNAITTVRSFAGEPLERERFGEYVRQSLGSGTEFGKAKANLESLNRGAVHLSLLALYGVGGWLVRQGLMPVRVLLSAIGFTFSLVFATQGVVQTLADARRVSASMRRVREVITRQPTDASMDGPLPPGAWWVAASKGQRPKPAEPYGPRAGSAAIQAAMAGPLELRNVSFSYPLRPDMPVLASVSLKLQRGTITALVGRSGAGKSTIASVLSRFYAPAAGEVLLNGHPSSSFTRGEWARAVALVSQETSLFEGTIRENITYGLWGHATEEQVRAAADMANAHEFIVKLPEGYDTFVGKRGVLLSGGQRQRIALARALAKDSPIILLDEATSSLDAQSEAAVRKAVENLVHGRTVLVIAHRLSTVQAADNIAVLDGGKIVEYGRHEELSKGTGLYSALVSSQSLALSGV